MKVIQCTQHTYPRSPAYKDKPNLVPIPPICKLPDDILLIIATDLDLVSLAQLRLTTTKAHTLFYTTLNSLKDKIYLQTHKTCLEKALTHLKKINLTGRPLFLRRQANTSIWELDTPNPDLCDQKSLCLKAKSCASIAHLYKEIDHHFAEELFENASLHANGITDRDIKRETHSYIQLQNTIAFSTRQEFIDARDQIKQYIKLQKGPIRGRQLPINQSELSALTDLSLEQTKTNPNSAHAYLDLQDSVVSLIEDVNVFEADFSALSIQKEICRKIICVAMKEPDLVEKDRLLSMICLAQIKTDETLDQKEAHKTLKKIVHDKFVDLTRLQLTTKQAILEPNQKKDIAMAQANKMKVP